MHPGMTLQSTIEEILREEELKRDVIVPAASLRLTNRVSLDEIIEGTDSRGEMVLEFGDENHRPTDLFHRQLAGALAIPGGYYERLRSQFPDLLMENTNTLLQAETSNRMVRTLDGNARAFLSDKYRRLDYAPMAQMLLPIIQEGGYQIKSLNVSDEHFRMQVISPKAEGEIRKGDVVQAGFIVSNSEVGLGALRVERLLYRLVCTNGMILPERIRQTHLGKRQTEGLLDFENLSVQAQDAQDKALWLGVRDTLAEFTNPQGFSAMLDGMRRAADDRVTGHPEEVVKVLAKTNKLKEDETASVLRSFIDSGDLTRWGLANAVTATANDVASYDRSVELEAIGGGIMLAGPREWATIGGAK